MNQCSCIVVWIIFDIVLLWDWKENWPFPVLWPLLVFQICWHIECSSLTTSSFRILNSSAGIPSPTLVLCVSFLCGSASKDFACSAGDLGLIPGLGRSPGEGKSYPLQYSGLENSMDDWVTFTINMLAKLENSSVTTGLEMVQSQRRTVPKNDQTAAQSPSFHMLAQ